MLKTVTANCDMEDGNESVLIYPNPSSGVLNIFILNLKDKNAQIYLYDALGQVIDSRSFMSIDTDQKMIALDMSEFVDGIYFIRVVSDNLSYFEKIVKKK